MSARFRIVLFRAVVVLASGAAACFAMVCSESGGPHAPDVVTLSVTPSSVSPGALIKATGFGAGFSTGDIVVEIGGRFSPTNADSDGCLYCAVPLFLNDSGGMEIPNGPADLIVRRSDKVIGEAMDALTITELPDADGSLEHLAAGLDEVLTGLDAIFGSFVQRPGVQEQYVFAFMAAMDSLLHGGENSLASALAAIPEGSLEERLGDYIASSSGLDDFVNAWADYVGSLAGDLEASGGFKRATAKTTDQMSDEDLARMMEFYTIVQRVAGLKVGPSSQAVRGAIGQIEALLGSSGQDVDHLEVSSRVHNFFTDFAFHLLPATLPAQLDTFDLEVLRESISPGDTTETRIFLTASNDPPAMDFDELIDHVVANLCDSLTAPTAQQVRARLEQQATLLYGEMTAAVASYAAQYPELELNPSLTERVDDMFWSVDVTSPLLYERKSDPDDIVMPCATVMEWYALEDVGGTVVLTVATSTSPNGWLLPQMPGVAPYLGSFGDVTKTSSRGVLQVDRGTLKISAAIAPSKIPSGRTGRLNVQARYHTESDSVPADDVAISLSPSNCGVDPTGGTTDAEGVFGSTVTPTGDMISVTVSAIGVGGSSASATATATRAPNTLLECYKEYTDRNCFHFKVLQESEDTLACAVRWSYNVEENLIGGWWLWNTSGVDSLDDCDFEGTYVGGAFLTSPNADCNGFTFDVGHGSWKYTVTVLVSKNQSGQCVWTGSYTRVPRSR